MKSIKLYMNILPLLVIFMLIGGAGYFLFGQDIKLPNKEDRLTKITRVEGFPVRISVTGERRKQRRVIRSEAELNDFLAKVDPEGQVNLKENFDFRKNILIATATEPLEGTYNKYKIKRVTRDDNDRTLTIIQELTLPIEACEETAETPEKSIIVDLVQLRKTDWKIEFELEKRKLPCNAF